MFENFKIPNELRPADPRFGCGPSLVPMEYVKKLYETGNHLLGTSHRKAPIKNLVKEVQDGLRKYFRVPADYAIVLGNGGATLLFDMIALGMVEKKAAHFTCGEFSEKWFKSSEMVPWIEAQQITVAFGEGIEAKDIADADTICMTLNETSTGVQLPSIPSVHTGALVVVDATSGAGQVPCDVSKVDCFFFSPQKVFASEGGLWIAILSPKAVDRVNKIADDKKRYIPEIMSWKQAISNGSQNQTYNTPSISTIYFLNEQVKCMNELGYDRVIEEAKRKANLLYSWGESKPYLSVYVKEQKFRSIAVACINVDEKYGVDPLIKIFEKEKVAYGIDGYRRLGKNQFRISLFHNVKYEDLERLTKLISMAIEAER
ncbi:MAG: phosphoserine transaminase [Oligoflexia bacterium]|nr:phosphoserine transaminase [Oligoflexia bacterium]MBF0364055.1 phosphoserine transaminase [Oligoflexia bacterium]